MSRQPMQHAFVCTIPETLEADTLYVSIGYVTTSHLCACGCGREVVLPLHPTKWRMTFDGASVSMSPSIGSRALSCRSHYWIEKGEIHWAGRMNDVDFDRALERDQRADRRWYDEASSANIEMLVNDRMEVTPSLDQSPFNKEEISRKRNLLTFIRANLARFFGG